jgi:hypothetical protein
LASFTLSTGSRLEVAIVGDPAVPLLLLVGPLAAANRAETLLLLVAYNES